MTANIGCKPGSTKPDAGTNVLNSSATNTEVTSNDAAIIGQLVNENNRLRARIQQLEELLHREEEDASIPDSVISTPMTNHEGQQPHEEIIASFENLHMGTSDERPSPKPIVGQGPFGDIILSLLPIRKSSEKIVKFSLDMLGWVHCALNAPKFMEQHDSFWDALNVNRRDILSNHSWMAIYFSVLSVSV